MLKENISSLQLRLFRLTRRSVTKKVKTELIIKKLININLGNKI